MRPEQPIETPRLLLRTYRDDDKDFCVGMWCGECNRYMSDPSLSRIDNRYLACFDGMADDPDGYYLVAEFKESHERVGTFCLFPTDGNYDIGYCVAKAHWREGLATEMMAGAVAFVKGLGGSSLSCEVADDNAASRALLAKFGFVEAQETRYKKWNEEVYFDAHVYALTLT